MVRLETEPSKKGLCHCRSTNLKNLKCNFFKIGEHITEPQKVLSLYFHIFLSKFAFEALKTILFNKLTLDYDRHISSLDLITQMSIFWKCSGTAA